MFSESEKKYSLVEINNSLVRVYDVDTVDIFDAIASEFEAQINILKLEDHHYYCVYNNPIHDEFFGKEDWDYINLSKEEVNKFGEYIIIPRKVIFFKKEKLKIMNFLETVKNLSYYIIILKLDSDNKFYYDLFLMFKGEHDVNVLYSYNSVIVKLEKILYINNFNFNWQFLKSFLNFQSEVFKEVIISAVSHNTVIKNTLDCNEWPERKIYESLNINDSDSYEYKFWEDAYYSKLNDFTDFEFNKKIIYLALQTIWVELDPKWDRIKVENPTVSDLEYEIRPDLIAFSNLNKYWPGFEVDFKNEEPIIIKSSLLDFYLYDLLNFNNDIYVYVYAR